MIDRLPLWVVEREGVSVHLLGGLAGPRDRSWLTNGLRELVESADEVWTEVEPDPDGSRLITELGVDTERALSAIAGERRRARLTAAAGAVGVDVGDLDILRPWLAAQALEQAFRAGPGESMDVVIRELAGEAGRHEMPFEGAVRALAGLDEDAQFGLLDWTLELIEGAANWPDGDQVARLRDVAPAFHRRLVAARNRDWALRIEDMLDAATPAFILVGALHLVGVDGILELLVGRGLSPARVA